MAQRTAYFQNNLRGQEGPTSLAQYPLPTYSHPRRSSHEMAPTIQYSGLNGYGASDTSHPHEVAISHRSRASLGVVPDYGRAHHQLPHSHTPIPWDAQTPEPYGYGQVPSSSYSGQSWPVDHPTSHMEQQSYYQRHSLHDQGTQYMGMVGVADGGLTRGQPHIAASTMAPMLSANHSPHSWANPSNPVSDPQSFYMFNNNSRLRPSTEMSVNGFSFSEAPSPASSPSPQVVNMSPNLGPHRTSVDTPNNVKKCSHCHATSTPLWRRNPMNMKPLCNACGLYLQQRNKLRPQELIDASIDDDETTDDSDRDPSAPKCSHCQTYVTSVWRRSKTGEQLCNACGVYLRLRGKPRPLSLKQKKIKPRPHSSRNTAK
ncbi:hypothetical protein AX15_003395 [Amanita polypyramis BW_CC]|nr:hypothetical protein AX15_003395 [Amanita polypyramis BW_CC]